MAETKRASDVSFEMVGRGQSVTHRRNVPSLPNVDPGESSQYVYPDQQRPESNQYEAPYQYGNNAAADPYASAHVQPPQNIYQGQGQHQWTYPTNSYVGEAYGYNHGVYDTMPRHGY
jgi:hypothetical protein